MGGCKSGKGASPGTGEKDMPGKANDLTRAVQRQLSNSPSLITTV